MPWKREKRKRERRYKATTTKELRFFIYLFFFIISLNFDIFSNPNYNQGLRIGFGLLASFSLFAWLVRHEM